MRQQTKIAVFTRKKFELGARDHIVDYLQWEKLDGCDGLGDYDVVIIDLISLRNRSSVRWHIFENLLNLSITKDILIGGGRIIVMGNPYFQHQSVVAKKKVSFLSWTGLHFDWVGQSGDTVVATSDKVPEGVVHYMKHLKKWHYSLRACEAYPGFLKVLANTYAENQTVVNVHLDCHHFYRNKYNCSLAFTASFVVEQEVANKSGEPAVNEVARLGPMTFLPEIALDSERAIEIVLREICGATTTSPEPAWARRMEVPDQEALDKEITNILVDIEDSYDRLTVLETRRVEQRQALRLLYDSGSGLEQIVRQTLRELGATVTDPVESGKPATRITIKMENQTLEGILKIRSTSGDILDEKDLARLGDWVSQGIETDRKAYKGILIGNSAIDKAPDDRPDPVTFQFHSNANMRHFAVMTTVDLYQVWSLYVTQQLDCNKFWSLLFSSDGSVDMRQLQIAGSRSVPVSSTR